MSNENDPTDAELAEWAEQFSEVCYSSTVIDPSGWAVSIEGRGDHPDGWSAVARRVSDALDPVDLPADRWTATAEPYGPNHPAARFDGWFVTLRLDQGVSISHGHTEQSAALLVAQVNGSRPAPSVQSGSDEGKQG